MKVLSLPHILKFLPFLLVLILFLGVRLYQISNIPTSLYWDEASIGYNAYSIITTTQDEWGKSFPLNFRAFGEFKLPIYIYSVALAEIVLGANTLAVRLPAVLFSLITVIITFLLTFRMTKNTLIATFSSLFLSTSPWFFIFSRVGYEANAGLAFFVIGVYLLTFFKEKKYFLILGVSSFIASMYSYNSFRVVVPVTLFIFLLFGLIKIRDQILKSKVIVGVALILLLVGIFPIAHSYLTDTAGARFNTVSIFNESLSKPQLLRVFIGNYLSHFSPGFLFLSGDAQVRMQQGGWGELLWVELPFLFIGTLVIILRKDAKYLFFLLFVLIAPLPAAITNENPHSLRSITAIPFLSVISALGVGWVIQYIKGKLSKKIIAGSIVIVLLLSFGFYFRSFIQSYNIKYSEAWQYPYQQVFTTYQSFFPQETRVVVSDSFSQPYIFALWYLKVNTDSFRNSVSYNNPGDWGFSTVYSFGKFVFPKQKDLAKIERRGDLVFSAKEQVANRGKQIGMIKFLNGTPALWVYEL